MAGNNKVLCGREREHATHFITVNEYKKILAGAAPYNGDIIKVGQGYAQFYPANEEVLRTIWLVGCVGISEEGIEKMCDQLSTSD